jgi:hypothetical protein
MYVVSAWTMLIPNHQNRNLHYVYHPKKITDKEGSAARLRITTKILKGSRQILWYLHIPYERYCPDKQEEGGAN